MNTIETERTIDLRVLFFRVLKRWRLLILFLVLGLLFGVALKYIQGGKTAESPAETGSNVTVCKTQQEYTKAVEDYNIQKEACDRALLDAQTTLLNYEAYMEGSLLPLLDPYNVSTVNARLVVSAAASDESSPNASAVVTNALRYIVYTVNGCLESSELYEKLYALTGKEDRHLRELIFVTPVPDRGCLEVSVNYTDLQTAEQIMDELLNYAVLASRDIRQEGIASYKVETVKGFSGTAVSSTINNLKTNMQKNLSTYKTNLTAAEGAVSALSVPVIYHKRSAKLNELVKNAVLFGLVFLIAGIVLVALRILIPHKILSSEEAEQSLGLQVFTDYGSLAVKHTSRFDKWILRNLEGKTFDLDTDAHSEVVRVSSETALQNADTLILLSTSDDEALDKIAESLIKVLPDLRIETVKGVLKDPALLEKLKEGAAAMIVEKLGKARRSAIVSELGFAKSRGADVKGAIFYE